MLDLIHPASNEILHLVNRGGPKDDKDWAAVRRAITLTESANLLVLRCRARDQGDRIKDAKLLAAAGAAAYKAAHAKDAAALGAVAAPLDQSCTVCHKQYRPEVFPRQGDSQ
jgi:hypothetical protein